MTLHSFQNNKKFRALIRRYTCCTCAIVHLCNDGAFIYNVSFPVGCLFRALFNDK